MNGLEALLAGPPLAALGAAFAGGVLASLAPCVYPMVPVVSAYVGSRTEGDKTRSRSFLLSLVYVIGMAVVYSLLGMAAALTGGMFGRISTNPWALLLVANVLMLLGLNILEVVPIPVWTSRHRWKPAAGGLLGAFLVGAASGLVASPCTSPVLFGLLTYVAIYQSVFYGGFLLFTFTMGMGILLIVFGTFSGIAASLPKPGRWMIGVKKALGLLMLILAQYYLVSAGMVWF